MSWQILVGFSVVIYAVSVLLQKTILKHDKSDAISFSIIFQVGVSLVTALLVLIVNGKIPMPNLSGALWSILAMTALYGIANIFIFNSLKSIDASKFTIIFSSKTLFAVLGSIFLLNDKISFLNWFGLFLILAGVVIVSLKDKRLNFEKGVLLAFGAAICFGLANTNDKFLVGFFDPYTYTVIGFLLPAIFIAAIYPKKISGVKTYFKKEIIWKLIVLCGLYGVSAISFFTALQKAPSPSLVFAVNAFGGVLTVILSVIFLKEREFLPRKFIGAILSLIGLLLVNK